MSTLYLFHGEDSYTSIQKTAHWQKAFEEKYGDLNVEIFEGEKLTAGQFSEAVSTLPFLSEKKLIIVRDFFHNAPTEELKKVAEKLDQVDDNCIVVFVERHKADARTSLYKNLKKKGEVKEFPLMDKDELIQWIATEVQKQNQQLPSRQIHQLADNVGPNLWQMKQEIEKLSLYANGQPVSDETIEKLISPNLHTTIFKLTDYLAVKNRQQSLKTLNTLLESGENIIQVLFMIVRHFRILIQIQDCLAKGMDKTAITKKIRQHPFAVQNGMKQVSNFTPETLTVIYKTLLDIDIATKSGTIRMTAGDITELRLALETFIVKLCS